MPQLLKALGWPAPHRVVPVQVLPPHWPYAAAGFKVGVGVADVATALVLLEVVLETTAVLDEIVCIEVDIEDEDEDDTALDEVICVEVAIEDEDKDDTALDEFICVEVAIEGEDKVDTALDEVICIEVDIEDEDEDDTVLEEVDGVADADVLPALELEAMEEDAGAVDPYVGTIAGPVGCSLMLSSARTQPDLAVNAAGQVTCLKVTAGLSAFWNQSKRQ
ncbi:hypothetical protein BP5796_01018 [Coleophoma crateriformis]|uniref:Uncharacterized protein n=1 Tax=Coleophoma crateriformis TaxID=565419 RepID=A0A3D8T9P3_9HELO|nr:hypothetical protein BP5796_01018 [Coleophoma crateriformis]